MRDFTYAALELAGTFVLAGMALSVLLLVYATLGLPLLTAVRALQRFMLLARARLATLFQFIARPLLPTRRRLGGWRRAQFSDVVRESDEMTTSTVWGSRVTDLFLATFVFAIAVVTTLLLIVVSATLVGLAPWDGAENSLPWLFGVGIVSAMVYAAPLLRVRQLATWTFGVGLTTVLLFAFLRGVDQWLGNIVDTNVDRAIAAGAPEVLAPWLLTDLRDFLPLPIFITAELAIVLGASIAHRGLRGLWLLAVLGPTIAIESLITVLALAVFVVAWVFDLTLSLMKRLLDVLTAPSVLLYNWIRSYKAMSGALRLKELPTVQLVELEPLFTPAPAAPDEEPVKAEVSGAPANRESAEDSEFGDDTGDAGQSR